MRDNDLEGILAFIQNAESLKNTFRYAFTSNGKQESAAEHSWRLCLLIMVCAERFSQLSLEKLLKLAIIHDLPEAICGDIPAPLQGERSKKIELERASLVHLTTSLPTKLQSEIIELWEEYEESLTEEAKCVKALDKIETLIQHNQGINPSDFDYAFNLSYGSDATAENSVASALRKIVDADTKKHLL